MLKAARKRRARFASQYKILVPQIMEISANGHDQNIENFGLRTEVVGGDDWINNPIYQHRQHVLQSRRHRSEGCF
jgi:hypothetical protein